MAKPAIYSIALTAVMVLLVSINSYAVDLAQSFNFDGVLLDSNNAPITSASTITLRIYDPNKTCLLYEESQSVTADSQGNFSIKVGSATGDTKRTANDPTLSWATVFQNDAQVRASGANCAGGYTPSSGDNRYLRVIINSTTLSPDFNMNSVPTATVAETLQGKKPTDFVQIATASTMNANLTLANGRSLRFLDGTTNTVGFTAPATATTTIWTLPAADGTNNQCLATNGTGTLSWITPGIPASGGTISSGSLTVNGSAAVSVSTSATTATSSITSSTSGTAVFGRASSGTGSTVGGEFQSFSTTGTALIATAGNAATKGLIVNGASGQTANLSEWSVNGTALNVIDSSGKLGIGTTTPSYPISILTSGTNNSLWMKRSANTTGNLISYLPSGSLTPTNQAWFAGLAPNSANYTIGSNNGNDLGSHWLTIDYTGNVGIGTTSPTAKFDIYGDTTSSGPTQGTINISGNRTGGGATFANINFSNHDAGPFFTATQIAGIKDTANSAALTFSTSTSTTLTEKMRIDNAGNVGIGTSTPASMLQVNGGIQFGTDAAACAAGKAGTIRYNAGSVEYCNGTSWGSFTSQWSTAGSDIYYSAGKVGIGTATPTSPLHVVASGGASNTIPVYINTTHAGPSQSGIGIYSALTASGDNQNNLAGYFTTSYSGASSQNVASVFGSTNLTSAAGVGANIYGATIGTSIAGPNGSANRAVGVAGSVGNTSPVTTASATGVYAIVTNNNGTMTNAYGVDASVSNTATVTNAYGIYSSITNTSTITNAYGVHISTILGTNKWSLYSSDATAPSYFAGNVGVGIAVPTTKLQVAGEISPSADNAYSLGDGALRFTAVYAVNGAIQTSDVRLKKNIRNSNLGLNFVSQLRPVSYYWNSGADKSLHYGFIAQELENTLASEGVPPESGAIIDHDTKSDRYAVKYSELIAPVVRAIQELFAKSKETQEEITQLRKQISELQELHRKNIELEHDNATLKERVKKIEQILN